MKSQLIKTRCATAELSGKDGLLVLECPTESVSLRGHVAQEIDVTLTINEREMFSGTASELGAGLEAVHALQNLRGNHTMRQALSGLVDNGDATAVLRYLNQR